MFRESYIRAATLLLTAIVFFTGDACKKSEPKTAYIAGQTYYGSQQYVRYIAGDANCPIILSSPHDGELGPADMADRDTGTSVRDIYATDLTLKIADSIKKLSGLRPHVIINDLKRIKVEPNRSLAEGRMIDPKAVQAYQEYHDFISQAQKTVITHRGKGLYVDIHGHAHAIARIEIGYLLSIADLNKTDAAINGLSYQSSIYDVAQHSSLTFSSLIRGPQSLGSLFEQLGVPAIPSSNNPQPLSDPYFNGGYCTYTYGSVNGGSISAVQLETPGPLVRNTASLRAAAAGKMARAILSFMSIHYQL